MIFSEAKAAVELVKDLAAHLRQTGNHDPAIMQKFEDLRSKVLSAYETEIELRDKIRQLEQEQELKQMPYDEEAGLYYNENESGQREYFCQRCADVDKKKVRVVNEDPQNWYCMGCQNQYRTRAARAAERASIDAYNERLKKGRTTGLWDD